MDITGAHFSSIEQLEHTLAIDTPPHIVQVYLNASKAEASKWMSIIQSRFPNSLIVGASVERHICNGIVHSDGATLVYLYCPDAVIQSKLIPFSPNYEKGYDVAALEGFHYGQLTLILLNFTTTEPHAFLDDIPLNKEICGIRAGLLANESWIFYCGEFYDNAAILISLTQEQFWVSRDAYADELPVGRSMTVTLSNEYVLNQIDHLPARQIYQRYLSNGAPLEHTTLSRFALQAEHQGREIKAAPAKLLDDGSMQMTEKLPIGAKVRFLYCHTSPSLLGAKSELQALNESNPSSILIFNCISRTDFHSADGTPTGKLSALTQIAPSYGAYGFGEVFGNQYDTRILHHALTFCAFRDKRMKVHGKPKKLNVVYEEDIISPVFNLMSNAFKDLSEERLALLSEHQHQGEGHDRLYDLQTGLLNRQALISHIYHSKNVGHVVIFRIRNFHLLNQQYGYHLADEVVAQLSQVIQIKLSNSMVNMDATCYRLSASELALAINENVDPTRLLSLLKHLIHEAENQDYTVSDRPGDWLTTSLCVGVSSLNDANGKPLCERKYLLMQAAEARRFAQDNHQSLCWSGHLPNHDDSHIHLDWIKRINTALRQGDMLVYFQPYYDLQGNEVGAEALLRARIDDEIFSPGVFLEAIKNTHLYTRVTQMVLRECERLLNQHPDKKVAINFSILDFRHEATLNAMRDFFDKSTVRGRVTLELTESESVEDYEWISQLLEEFRSKGALIAIDDFGSGYSNLEKLIELHPDILKLDGSIVQHLDTNENLYKLILHINHLAHALGIKTQAEYVHSEAVRQKLIDIKVDYLQGFYLSEPIPEKEWIGL